MANRLQPRRWLFFALDTVPATDPIPLYRWAQRPIVYQAFPAFIEGRVPVDGWSEIVRSSSSPSGEYSIDHGAVVLNDADALIRDLLNNYATQWFIKRMGHFLLLSDQAIVDGLLPPRQLFAGRCSDVQILDNRRAQLDFEDVFAPYLDRLYPQYTMNDAYPWRFGEQPVVDGDLNSVDPGVQVPPALRDQVLCLYYGPHVQTKLDPVTGLPTEGMCPVFFAGPTFLTSGSAFTDEPTPEQAALMGPLGISAENWGGWFELFICAGDLQVPNVYASDLLDPPSSVLFGEDRYGTDILAPGHPAWPFATTYVVRSGFICTVMYARGPVAWQHITGVINITVDVCGWPDEDGVPIDQAGFAWQSFHEEHVLSHDGEGFTGGPQTGLVYFPPTVDIDRSMIWTSKIQDWQAMTAERLGTDKGYLISMGLTKPTSLREIKRTFNVTFDCFETKNSAGQAYIYSIDDTASPDDGVPIRERIELLRLPAPHIEWAAIENEIDYTIGWNNARQEPRTITITIRDQDAIDALGGDVRKVDGIRSLAYTADDLTATDTMGRRMMRLKQPLRMQPLPMRTGAVDREHGEQVRITHQDGFGPKGIGYQLRPMVLMHTVQNGDDITMQALDVYRLLVTGFPALEDEDTEVPVSEEWDIGTAYESGDLVTVTGSPNGGTWLAVRDTVAGEEPGVSDAWVLVADTESDWFVLGDETLAYPPPVGAYELR